MFFCFFFSSRRRHTRCGRDWSSDVCSSDLGLEEEGRGARDAVAEDVRTEPARFACGPGSARERDREAPLGVGERDVDGVLYALPLEEPSLGLFQLVLAELEVDGPDHGDGNRSHAGARLGRFGVGLEILVDDAALEPEPLLADADRAGIVPTRPAGAGRVAQIEMLTSLTSSPSD